MAEPATGSPPDPQDVAACRAIAEQANANFLHAARLLPRFRQDYFYSAYAAMRLIDDTVDERFLPLPDDRRRAQRDEVLAEIAAWLAQCLGEREDGPLPPAVRRALRATAGRGDLGSWPWHALAGAMRRDVEERPMTDWSDFLAYAEGATVAPATVFIHILACRADRTDALVADLAPSVRHFAQDLGIYCYIVHILRDLARDSARSERLLTIPDRLLAEAGLSREGVANAIETGHPGIRALGEELIGRAAPFRARGHDRMRELLPRLDIREGVALRGLIAIYDRQFERFAEDYPTALPAADEWERELRQRLLGEIGA